MRDTYPRQYARTRRLSLGEPKAFRIAPDEQRILFLRSRSGNDPVTALWSLDAAVDGTWVERLVVDPIRIMEAGDSDLPAAERARRERLREQAEGITSYDCDGPLGLATFTLGGHVFVADLVASTVQPISGLPGAFDPRLSPDGTSVAFIVNGRLQIAPADGSAPAREIIGDDTPSVDWAIADFIASEELDRHRGFWWSRDSQTLAVARVDNTDVRKWFIADPAHPDREPAVHRYPAAGTENADVRLFTINPVTNDSQEVVWDRREFPYLVHVDSCQNGFLVVVMNRAQTKQQTHQLSSDGKISLLFETQDDCWVERTPGTPLMLEDGSVLTTVNQAVAGDAFGTCALATIRAGIITTLTPACLQVRQLVSVQNNIALIIATASADLPGLNANRDPGSTALVAFSFADGSCTVVRPHHGGATQTATVRGNVTVLRTASPELERVEFVVLVNDQPQGSIVNLAEVALVTPKPTFFFAGKRDLPSVIFFPSEGCPGYEADSLPVLMDPYGGPHAQRVVKARNAHASSQWFADQGFAVLVTDGRGTPGPGPIFERAVYRDLAGPVLDDQIAGLEAALDRYPKLDASRVGIRGWSFGGYLAALAVLRRPDVFHAGIAGAPVTEWRLYDTGYTERYLGNPTEDPGPYDACSLLPDAHKLVRPLMIIHGLADDNVVAAHSLQLSSALLAAGCPHEVLPLSGVTHMTPQEVVAENLLKLQIEFLWRSLPKAE